MKAQKIFIAVALAAAISFESGLAQNSQWYFGSGLGAQQWRGPLNAVVGLGGELVVGKHLSRHGGLALNLGFASLPFQQSGVSNGVQFIRASREANLFHGDFLVDLHPFGMRSFSPFLRIGSGVLNVQVGSAARKNYISGVFGGGLHLQLTHDLALNLSGNYHHLVGQELDGFAVDKSPTGYAAVRLGFTFSALPGDNADDESWFSTSDSELSPFENAAAEEASTPALVDAAKDSSQNEEEEDFTAEQPSAEEDEETREVAPPDRDTASESNSATPPPVAEEKLVPPAANTSENVAAPSDDPFANFNRKLDLLDREANASPSEQSTEPVSPLGDEPKFEEFYPRAKQESVTDLREKLFAEEAEEEQAEDEIETEPVTATSDFEMRLSRLEEQEDFLSPQTKIADADEPLPEIKHEAARVEPAPIPPVSNGNAHINHKEQAPVGVQTRTPNSDWRNQSEPNSAPSKSAASRMATPASSAPTPSPARVKPTETSSGRNAETTDQELIELRAILDKLDRDGASRFERSLNSENTLALNADPEVAELRVRLDELTSEEVAHNQPSQAYEAFKDRLGLEAGNTKTAEPEEWDRQELKSQITTLDNELLQKEEDLTAIRTALAQSAASGAALPMRTTVTRGSFAQGYESALNSFYMQEYDEAIEKFSRLIAEYPSHTLTSNCYYWLGEAQYGFGDYITALVSFNRVLTFQRSLKKDNALLMLGKTYLALQRPIDARAMFNRLLSEYPASDAVTKAQALLQSK